MQYNKSEAQEYDVVNPETYRFERPRGMITWVDVDGTADPDILKTLCDDFKLNDTLIMDVGTGLRPRVDEYPSYFHIILRMIRYKHIENKEIVAEQVHILLGKDFVVSVQEGEEGDVFNGVRDHIHTNRGPIRKLGPDFLVYALLEAVLDSYFTILEEIGEDVEDLQDDMLDDPQARLLLRVRDLKRTVRALRKSVWPLREVIAELEREDSPLIDDDNNVHFRRAYEHTVQAMDVAEAARDVLSDMLDIYLSSISNRLNQIMKTLTIFTAFFMPLSFIAGVYGMNFRFMPELTWAWGYPAALGLMVLVAIVMTLYFRRKGWW
jgi:magnesium transporter